MVRQRPPFIADGTESAARRLSRVLNNDPMMGILRHADAGYEQALASAKSGRVKLPMGGVRPPATGDDPGGLQ